MLDLILFNPLAALFASTTALVAVAWILSSRRLRTIAACLLTLSPAAPLFLVSFILTATLLLVHWLAGMMPNAEAMSRAVVRLEELFTEERIHGSN